jgi:hypothetical protein
VKAIQARWQENAKAMPLAQRDERALWDELRAACDAVFEARHAKRKEEDDRRQTGRRALEETCEQLEQLARRTDGDEQDLRRALREVQEQWKQRVGRSAVPPGLESRFRNAARAVETMVSARARSREAAVWQTLAAKERLCEELDRLVGSSIEAEAAASQASSTTERWAALPAVVAGWEKKLVARRDAALRALADPVAAGAYAARIEQGKVSRHDGLLELEMLLKLDSPPELQAQRLALQVRQLKERFSSAATGGARTPIDLLVDWCSQPGVVETQDRQRCERVFAAMEKAR